MEPGLGALSRLVLNHICIFSIFRRSDNGRLETQIIYLIILDVNYDIINMIQ